MFSWRPPFRLGFNNRDEILLERFCYSDMGTFSKLTYKNFTCYVVERPWLDNIPSKSCIPEYSNYTVELYDSPTFGKSLIVEGGTVSKFPDSKYRRSAILFHVANTMDDLEGCLGCGNKLGYVKGKWAVLNSESTTNKFLNMFKKDDKVRMIVRSYKV